MINYLVIFLFAGHGMLYEGRQVLLYNEFEKSTRFYKMFLAEQKLRSFAELYPNAYLIGIFACCRQLHDTNVHTGKGYSMEQVEKMKIGEKQE